MSASLPSVESLRKSVQGPLEKVKSLELLEKFRIAWLGRSGKLTNLLKQLGELPLEKRKTVGKSYNEFKLELEVRLNDLEKTLAAEKRRQDLETSGLDITLPGVPRTFGTLHPITQVLHDVVDIFRALGFVVADGPEIESEFNNFDALNIPANHPARDMHDTFYLQLNREQLALPQLEALQSREEPNLLRTHTSPVQVRVMQDNPPPIAIVVPGRVYRHEAMDATHLAVFHQLEGLLVDTDVSFADLKGTLSRFVQDFYGPSIRTRFRPSFFPFTEPSAEMDISCFSCGGGGCGLCKQSGWIELGGAGMVHPNVFRASGVDPERYSGFAFGMGIERLAMFKYGVKDLRQFYENDVRFLEQFK
jgi:phenylalanyl-tRNA synthetase alpha chain